MGRVGERSECHEVETKLNVSSKIGEQIQGVQLINLYHNSPGPTISTLLLPQSPEGWLMLMMLYI